jgi:peroxiredoxin (alkyl hydroperoxide reductase subunit C)
MSHATFLIIAVCVVVDGAAGHGTRVGAALAGLSGWRDVFAVADTLPYFHAMSDRVGKVFTFSNLKVNSATFRSAPGELLGLSIDSIYSHLAWMQSIQNNFGVEIPFPIIDDIKMEVAQAYGMIHPGAADTQAVRATFFIDPEGKLRAMVYYPMSNGRSIEEFVRLLQAMQTSDEHKIATPEGWTPGCDVIVPPPKTPEAIAKRKGEGYAMKDWYFSTKSL